MKKHAVYRMPLVPGEVIESWLDPELEAYAESGHKP